MDVVGHRGRWGGGCRVRHSKPRSVVQCNIITGRGGGSGFGVQHDVDQCCTMRLHEPIEICLSHDPTTPLPPPEEHDQQRVHSDRPGLCVTRPAEHIDDAIDQGVTVCLEQTISLELASKYPELKYHVITDAQSTTEAMAAGKCGAMFMTENQWLTEIRSETPQCDKNKVGSVAFTVPNTIPVRTEYIPVMSWVLLKARSKGWVEQEKTIAKAKFFKRSVPECHLDQPSSKRDGQITLAQLIGPLLITFVCTTFSLLLKRFKMLSCVAKTEKRARDRLEGSLSQWQTEHSALESRVGHVPPQGPLKLVEIEDAMVQIGQLTASVSIGLHSQIAPHRYEC